MDKPTTDYMRAKSQKDGLDRWCKPCCADYQRAWREKRARAESLRVDPPGAVAVVGTPAATTPAQDGPGRPARRRLDADPAVAQLVRRKGWRAEVVGGVRYARPDSAEAIASPEGQAALEGLALATALARRKANGKAAEA